MKKRKVLLGILAIASLFLTACSSQADTSTKKTVVTGTPTIFFHGYGSSYHAEEHMVNAAKKAGTVDSVIRAQVAKSGKVTLYGTWKKDAKNPVVEVGYDNNRSQNYELLGQYATNVVKKLQKRYGIKKMNMVGHSQGNVSIIYYMLQNGQNKKMPKLVKQVDMAGHFDGLNYEGLPAATRQPAGLKLDKNGKPNKMNSTYKEMTGVRKTYPKSQVSVLNIIGDKGHGTDGTVENISSLTLKYLVADRAKSYKVVKFTGKMAQHSKLHENPKVDKVLIKFLWGK